MALWPRGGAKSTSAELATAALGVRRVRKYALYVSGTQDKADKHVATIGSVLEKMGVERGVNKYGSSKGWRRNRLWTADGFVVDALGLDTASRGIKAEDQRPDLIVLDDIDERHDSKEQVEKKQASITDTVLPTGAPECAVLAVQNIVHQGSVFDRLRPALPPFLIDRILSGPFPALEGFESEYDVEALRYHVTAGVPTWAGQDVAACENYINTWGLLSFKRECQHQVGDTPGALWSRKNIEANRVPEAPELVRIVVALDPSASSTDTSDECGINVAGMDARAHVYILEDPTRRDTPSGWARVAIEAFQRWKADHIYGEGNNGGEMVSTVIELVAREMKVSVVVDLVWASRGKQTRAEPTSTLYSENRVHHVGTLTDLEDEMCNWIPGRGKSPNRVDSLVWAVTALEVPTGADLISFG